MRYRQPDVGARLRCARLMWWRRAESSLRPKMTRQKSQKSHCRTPTQIFGPQLRSPARHASRYRHQGMPGRPTPRGRQAARVGEVHSTPNPVVVAFRGRASRSLLSSSLSPARVVFAAADTRVPRLLPLPCCCALARQLSNSRPLSTSVVLLYSWQASARDSGRIIHTGTVRHAAASAAAQARRRRRRRRQRHTG